MLAPNLTFVLVTTRETYTYIRYKIARTMKSDLSEEYNDGVIWNRITYENDIIYHSFSYSLFLRLTTMQKG